ncbi:AraC family transcriptional regulator [uncultured Eudoraea sp.]|uniref:helix-turn-helix domain-containing protein n=1 Tax=uncultured Eudoraea sp. TaxID=1035614 RepID=UPI00262D5455|nr:AraC family transcriptional regulator [uncultured Eudoraea sp.]
MNTYLIKNKITHNPVNHPLEDKEIDIILVNGEHGTDDVLTGSLKQIRPIVTYTKSHYTQSENDDIPFVLIPILVKYLLKLKESISYMNRKKALNTADRFLHKITAAIDENIDDHTLTMKKLSNLVFMSRSAFSKKIKKYTGLKPTEYINHYKLEKSKHLLLVTNWQISKIADHLGFCSQNYYCRLFKKNEGMNPSQFRKEHQNKPPIPQPKTPGYLRPTL